MEAFTTREKADEYMAKIQKQPVGFCPLIREGCNPECVCYVGPRIREAKDYEYPYPAFYVHGPYCGNEMFGN